MQVRTPQMQHEVMIEAVENHMPQVIVIDEIGTELEAQAARTIAERGVQLIGTAHGNTLDNLMLNPTLSDLIGGIQSVTLGDEEARRRRTQKSVLERKAPPTFDVIIEIQDRERVLVHGDVADTVDAMLRGDPLAPELRWRDEEGVHRSQSRPRPSPREQVGAERFAGLVGQAGAGWRTEPGWRGDGGYRGGYRDGGQGPRPGYRPGATGGWRPGRTTLPGERFTTPPAAPRSGSGGPEASATPRSTGLSTSTSAVPAASSWPGSDGPFVSGDIADRGPLERGATAAPLPRARETRELERQKAWRDQASKAIGALKTDEGTAPVNAPQLDEAELEAQLLGDDEDVVELPDRPALRVEGSGSLPTLRILPMGVSRKRLEQAIRDLQLPALLARDVDEADVVMTLRTEFRQKPPALREAEERALPIYVLKTNTVPQMQSSLTSIFSLEVDPREVALREAEEAINLVLERSEPVELAPQNAFIRRLQHQMAERANLVSRSRGREPYRRVRLYPEEARPWR
jgi:hypothetical protein